MPEDKTDLLDVDDDALADLAEIAARTDPRYSLPEDPRQLKLDLASLRAATLALSLLESDAVAIQETDKQESIKIGDPALARPELRGLTSDVRLELKRLALGQDEIASFLPAVARSHGPAQETWSEPGRFVVGIVDTAGREHLFLRPVKISE